MAVAPDVAVIGAGAFGAWTAWHLRATGHRVTLVEAFAAGHSRASSGGESRIIRRGYGNRALYSRWAQESLSQWKALCTASGQALFLETGVLWLGHDGDAHVDASERILAGLGVATEPLTREESAVRFPQLDLGSATRAVLEPGGGVLLARRAVRAAVDQARRRGVACRTATVAPLRPVRRVDAVELGDGSRLCAGTFVFACGPWLPKLFPRLLGPLLRVTRQEVFFFGPPAGDRRFAPPTLPAWIDFRAGAYGLPDSDGRGVKIGLTALGPPFDADDGDRMPSVAGLSAARELAAARLPALRGAPLLEARVCQYTNTSSGDLLLDRHPDHANVWLAGGGSGHGFKLGPAVGAYLASQLAGTAPVQDLVTLAAQRIGRGRTVL